MASYTFIVEGSSGSLMYILSSVTATAVHAQRKRIIVTPARAAMMNEASSVMSF